jgi:hypothetical protein
LQCARKGMPLTLTVDKVPAPSIRLKQVRGSPATSGEPAGSHQNLSQNRGVDWYPRAQFLAHTVE